MNQSMTPEQLQLLIAGYVLNDLSEEEATIMEELLNNAEVRQAVEEMQLALEQAYAPEEIQPSPQLRSIVMGTATTENPPQVTPISTLPRWAKPLGLLAALLIGLLSLSNYFLWRSLQTQQARLQSVEKLVFSLKPTDNINLEPKVIVTVDPETLQGTLIVEALPSLEPGKVYVLWTVLTPDAPFTTDSKGAILTQVFTASTTGEQTQPIILPRAFQAPDVVKAIAVTIEDAAAPQRHQSSPILIEKL